MYFLSHTRTGNFFFQVCSKLVSNPQPPCHKLNTLYKPIQLHLSDLTLTLSQTSPGFYLSAVQFSWKHCEKKQFLLFPLFSTCYRRPLLQAWLLPHLNTIPNNCVGENSLNSVVIVLALGAQGHWFESCPYLIFLPCIYSFVSLLLTLFVRYLFEDFSAIFSGRV